MKSRLLRLIVCHQRGWRRGVHRGRRLPRGPPGGTPDADVGVAHARGAARHDRGRRRHAHEWTTHRGDVYPRRGTVDSASGKSARVLSRLSHRLRRREPLTICLTGDSISEGYDASGFHGVPPYQPAFGRLVASGLEQHSGGSVHLHNLATAGWTAADALWDTARIAAARPDLVIVAFGMNDACYAQAGEFVANVSGVLKGVRDDVPHVEFVLVSPMLPTPECTWVVPSRFEEYRAALAELTGEDVVLADVTGLWSNLVARRIHTTSLEMA